MSDYNAIQQKLIDYLEGTHDFLLEQAPEVIQQALRYEMISSITSCIFLVASLAVVTTVMYYNWKNPVLDDYKSRTSSNVLGIFLPVMISIGLLTPTILTVNKLIMLYVAPKYFLIQLLVEHK